MSDYTWPIRIVPPPFTAHLSSLDCRHSGLYSRRILVFRTPHNPSIPETVDLFKEALHLLVKKVPVLGAVIREDSQPPTGQKGWKEFVPGQGILLHVKDYRSKSRFAEYEASRFAPVLLPDEEYIPIPPESRTLPYDASEFQLNFIDGGILLSVCIVHNVSDGTGDTEILKILAGYVRGVQEKRTMGSSPLLSTSPQLGLERRALRGLKTESGTFSADDHLAMRIRDHPPTTGQLVQPAAQKEAAGIDSATNKPKEHLIKIYRISGDKLAQLKADASTAATRISTNDALVSVIWRCQLINRRAAGLLDTNADGEVKLLFPIGVRKILGLPPDYIGNAVYNQICVRKQGDILGTSASESLQRTAAIIRAGVNLTDRDAVAGFSMYAESATYITDFITRDVATIATSTVFMTSFLHSESILESDWGAAFGGRVRLLRCSDAGFAGALRTICFVLPKFPEPADGDESEGKGEAGGGGNDDDDDDDDDEGEGKAGGCEIQLSVHPDGQEAMEKDEIFAKYFQVL